jgi:hypothetical protein
MRSKYSAIRRVRLAAPPAAGAGRRDRVAGCSKGLAKSPAESLAAATARALRRSLESALRAWNWSTQYIAARDTPGLTHIRMPTCPAAGQASDPAI